LEIADVYLRKNIDAIPLKLRVFIDKQIDIQVPRWPTPLAHIPFPRDSQPRTGINPSRNGNLETFALANLT